jgi:lipoyl(octanoyl) transferase
MNKKIVFQDLGKKDYKATWDYQESLFQKIVDTKIQNRKQETQIPTSNYFLLHYSKV